MATVDTFTMKQGFAGDITFTIYDLDNVEVDLSGATVYFMIKNKKSDTDSDALISKDTTGDVTITDATGGVITVSFTRTETLVLTKNATAEINIRYSGTDIIPTKDIEVVVEKSVQTGTIT